MYLYSNHLEEEEEEELSHVFSIYFIIMIILDSKKHTHKCNKQVWLCFVCYLFCLSYCWITTHKLIAFLSWNTWMNNKIKTIWCHIIWSNVYTHLSVGILKLITRSCMSIPTQKIKFLKIYMHYGMTLQVLIY